jgi:CSLREA domain-containing protein
MGARRFLLVLPLVVTGMLYAAHAAAAATFTVNTNDDGDTVCTAAHCSLREAIKAANAAAGHDQIVFDIPPGGPQTIQPVGRSLPAVTDPVTIDATTQPGYSGTPIIQLDGSLAGPGAVGFDIPAGQSVVAGFVINGFGFGLGGAGTGYAIRLAGAGGTTIIGNYIGTDPTGTAAPRPNDFGVFVNSTDNTIGGTTPDKRNVVAGNSDGVTLYGTSTRNRVIGNYIGTDFTGTHVVGIGSVGVHVTNDAGGNVIGGGQGFESAGLPPAARAFFKITTGLSSISMGRAASALVSVVPEYARQ